MKLFRDKHGISITLPRLIEAGGFIVTLAWIIGVMPTQANELQLSINVDEKLNLMWNASSVTLNQSPNIIPNTQLEVSENLKNWKPISKLYAGGLRAESKTITITISKTNAIRYFRVKSQINLKNVNLQKKNLVGSSAHCAQAQPEVTAPAVCPLRGRLGQHWMQELLHDREVFGRALRNGGGGHEPSELERKPQRLSATEGDL